MRSLFFILLLSSGLVQAGDDVAVETLTYEGKVAYGEVAGPGDIKMPFVKMANAKVAAKINDQLFISQFGVMAPEKPGKVLSAADHIVIEGTRTQDFAVERSRGRVLTMSFDAEGCGAYCENYASYFSFDTSNGHPISAEDLLTPAGMRALDGRMKKERIAKYRQQIVSLRSQLKARQKKHDAKAKADIEDLEARISMNEDCMEQAAAPDGDSGMGAFAYNAFVLTDDAFRYTRHRCSNHASRALDDVDDVTLSIAYPEMRNYLTGYGKTLLLNEGDSTPANTPFGQILRGHLGGNIAISMLLRRYSDNSLGGVYFYDKYRKPITVSGRVAGNALELSEEADNGVAGAKMKLTISGGHLKGRWIGKKEFLMELNQGSN